jgi:hypothetical protein
MRTAWTPHAQSASSLAGEAVVSDPTGRLPVTIDQFPAVSLDAALQPSAARRIAAWRHRSSPT